MWGLDGMQVHIDLSSTSRSIELEGSREDEMGNKSTLADSSRADCWISLALGGFASSSRAAECRIWYCETIGLAALRSEGAG